MDAYGSESMSLRGWVSRVFPRIEGQATNRILSVDLLGRHVRPLLNVRHLVRAMEIPLVVHDVGKPKLTIVVGKQAS